MPSVTSRSLFVRGAAEAVTVSRAGRGRARSGAAGRPGSACRFSQKISTIRSFSLGDRARRVRAHEHVRQVPERARLGGGGSVVKTSSAAPRRRPAASASASAASSTTSPRAMFTTIARSGRSADAAGVEQAVGLGRVGRRQDDRVQARQDGVEVVDRGDLVGVDVGRRAVRDRADDADHVGVERAQEPRRLAADPPRPDHGHHLARRPPRRRGARQRWARWSAW